MPKQNYHYSGKSTPEALEHFREHAIENTPRLLRPIIRWAVRTERLKLGFTMVCDGCGTKSPKIENPVLVPMEREGTQNWRGTNWTHQARLDFCLVCTLDGTADRAVAAGAQPLGTYSLDVER